MLKTKPHKFYLFQIVFVLMIVLFSSSAFGGGKFGVYGIHMVPRGDDAENYSRPGFGFGVHLVAPFPNLANFFAGTAGFELINLLNETTSFTEPVTGFEIEQETSQKYNRFYIGGQIGGHGRGFIRPHAGVNLALVYYGIDTEAVVRDDQNPDNEIRKTLNDESHFVFGYDVTLGIDLNFWNKWNLDGGVRYVKSFALPQQLGEDSEKVHPEYFQIYLGIGISFRKIFDGDMKK